jgi:CelD/BcsL family acetyltransferase involved in cellulose biosynthesis
MKPWEELLTAAAASPYQTPGFILPWLETLGIKAGITPLFILKKDAQGTALALLCLGLKGYGLLRVAVFLGEKDANFNFGLFRPGFAPSKSEIKSLLQSAAKKLDRQKPDLFLFLNQPAAWDEWQNPFAALPCQASPSFAYATALKPDAEAFFKDKISKDTRKKLRKKEQRLAELGELRYLNDPDDPVLQGQILDAFFAQKIARFEALGITSDFADPAMRDFAERALRPAQNNHSRMELHALTCNDKIIAIYGGAIHRGHFSGFFNSFEAEAEVAKSSPCDLLLLKIIAAKCAQHVSSFDLGIGEARYKQMLCDQAIPLFDSFLGLTLKGKLAAKLLSSMQRLKRRLKQNPEAFALIHKLRARFAHTTQSQA